MEEPRSEAICVVFDMREDVWNKVVRDAKEEFVIDYEGTDIFAIEYNNDAEWHKALARFEGLIHYRLAS